MRTPAMSAMLALLLAAPVVSPAQQVQVEGEVRQPGAHAIAPGARFVDVIVAAGPTEQAYPLGAAVLRPAATSAQQRMKAGLQYDLEALSAADLPPAVAAQVPRFAAWLDSLPVTGRVRVDLEPRRMEVDRGSNRLAAEGDRFVYPRRPDTIRVAGAVAAPCELPHAPLRDAADYLRECPAAAGADRETLYVIQPDGEVQRLGIAAWNRSAAQALAPGAVVYVPLDERAVRDVAPEFNAGMAAFLATQHLPLGAP